MKSIAALMSSSFRSAAPAFGGIAPLPLTTDCSSASLPVAMRGA